MKSKTIFLFALCGVLTLASCQRPTKPLPTSPPPTAPSGIANTSSTPTNTGDRAQPAASSPQPTTTTAPTRPPATPPAQTNTRKPTSSPESWATYTSQALGLEISYPEGWVPQELEQRLVLAGNSDALKGLELEGVALLIRRLPKAPDPSQALAEVDRRTATMQRECTAQVGNESWAGVELQLVSPVSDRGYHAVLVSGSAGGDGWLIMASAPEEQWTEAWPSLQAMMTTLSWQSR